MIRAEPCLLSGSRDEVILEARGLQGSERLGNFPCYILTVWVGGGLGNGCFNGGWAVLPTHVLTSLPGDVLGRSLRLPTWD